MVMTIRFVTASGSGSRSGDEGQEVPVAPESVVQMGTGELDARIREVLHDEVAALFRTQLPEMLGSIKTAMIKYFDERYAAIAETVVATATSALTAVGEEPVRLSSIGT